MLPDNYLTKRTTKLLAELINEANIYLFT